MSIIKHLIEKDASLFLPVIEELVEQLRELFCQFVSEPLISTSISLIISSLCRLPDCLEPMLDVFIPIVIEALGAPCARESGMDMLIGMLERVETIEIPVQIIERESTKIS